MKVSANTLRIGTAVVVILGTISWLAFTGYSSNKSYYVTIAELGGMGDKAYHSNLRVEGFVQPGSIEQVGTHVDFVLNEYESHSPKAPSGHLLKVTYKGTEPPPDTFKDDAQALAEGTYAATASSTPRSFRPSAPANTLRSSPAQRPPLRRLRPQPSRPLHRLRRPRLPPPPKPPPTDRMMTNAFSETL